MLARGRVRGPIGSACSGWPDNHRQKRPAVCRYTLDRSHYGSFKVGAFVISRIVFTHEDFNGAEHA